MAKLFNRIERVEPGVQPVGFPQPGVDAIIMRERRTPCGLWETGEIAIRTPYRSKGYFDNEALTRQVFVQNPCRDDPEDLIYYTGDLGRLRPDGKIEIFGRVDAQIKIRGVRIEPNEIESQLLQHPDVRDAAVTVRKSSAGDKTLIGLIVLHAPASADEQRTLGAAIRDALKHKLHDAMVPSRIVALATLPYLPNGKLDRKAIAALELEDASEHESDAPAFADLDDRTRALVAGIEDILGVSITSLDKSFTDLGGDSLSYITASMLVEDMLGRLPQQWEKIPLSELSRFLEEPRAPQKSSWWVGLDITMLLRAISIVMITMSHTSAFTFVTATSTLFVISGMNFGKFLRPAIRRTGALAPTFKFILKFGIPAGLWELFRSFIMHSFWLPDLLLAGTFFQNPAGPHFTLWFLDVLAANLLLLALIAKADYKLIDIKSSSAATTRDSFWMDFSWVLVGIAMAFGQVASGWLDGVTGTTSVAPFKWFWMLGFGVLITQASSDRRKRMVSGFLAALAAVAYAGPDQMVKAIGRVDAFFFASVFAMIWIERVPVPRFLQRPLLIVASSTLFIYIVNHAVITHIMPKLGLPSWWPLEVVLAVAIGIIAKVVWDKAVATTSNLFHYVPRSRREESA